jgi:hypothetical protein
VSMTSVCVGSPRSQTGTVPRAAGQCLLLLTACTQAEAASCSMDCFRVGCVDDLSVDALFVVCLLGFFISFFVLGCFVVRLIGF